MGAGEKRSTSMLDSHGSVLCRGNGNTNIIPECLEVFPGECKGPVVWPHVGHGVVFSTVISCVQKT